MMAPTIERLTAKTAPLLTAAADDVLDGPVRPDQLQAFLADPQHFMFLAVQSGRCVGMVSGMVYLHPDKLPQVFLNEIGVAPAQQSRGIGRALVAQVLAEASRRGATYVWLGTEVDNLPARACFTAVTPPENWERDEEEPETFAFYGWELAQD